MLLEKNCHNVRVVGTENEHEFVEHVRDFPTAYIWSCFCVKILFAIFLR